jgi:hypothetical protein
MDLPPRLPAALLLLAAGLALHAPPALSRPPGARASQQQAARVRVKGTRVSLVPPGGFTEATRFHGFQQEETSASIMVTEFPSTYAEVLEGFTVEALATRNMKPLSRKPVKVGGHAGQLLHLAQTAKDVAYLKWVLVLGDASATLVVTATWREQDTKALSRPLESAVRSTRWQRDASPTSAPVLFTLKALPGLKEAWRMQSTAIYTRDGKLPNGPAEAPLLIVSPSLGTTEVEDVEAFNLARLRLAPGAADITVESSAPLTVDGMKGHEAVARAKHPATSKAVTLYQALLVNDGRYFLLQGRVGEADRATYLEHFKTVTRGLQRTPTP